MMGRAVADDFRSRGIGPRMLGSRSELKAGYR